MNVRNLVPCLTLFHTHPLFSVAFFERKTIHIQSISVSYSSVLSDFTDVCQSNGFNILDFGDLIVSCDATLDKTVDFTIRFIYEDEVVCSTDQCVGLCDEDFGYGEIFASSFEEILLEDPDISNVKCDLKSSGRCDILSPDQQPMSQATAPPARPPTRPPTLSPTRGPTPSFGTGLSPPTPSLGTGPNPTRPPTRPPTPSPTASSTSTATCVDTKIEFYTDSTAADEWNYLIDNNGKTLVLGPTEYENDQGYVFEDCLVEECLTFSHFDEGFDGGEWNITLEYGGSVRQYLGDDAPNGFVIEFGTGCKWDPPLDTTPSELEFGLLTGMSGTSAISYVVYDNSDVLETDGVYSEYSSPIIYGFGQLEADTPYEVTADAVGCVTLVLDGITADNFAGAVLTYDGDEVILVAPTETGSFYIMVEIGSQCQNAGGSLD